MDRGLKTLFNLSPRERQVLAMLSLDLSEKEVSAALGLRLSTVGRYRDTAYGKLGLRSRVQLVWRILLAESIAGRGSSAGAERRGAHPHS
ncbi:MAG: response regulator transcription factor [Planctomycetaceae bacterium]